MLLLKHGMGLRMKNFDIMGVHWKIRLLRGVHKKTIQGELPRIWEEAWTDCRFKGGGAWQKR